ncbi:tRNA (N6-threonylcarbamoyladenosine(37)-N6)-methyltransferase TrmO [Candidatus Aerophobetes bacterium]|nr:tRNA (N6-threonylcarbamoyladenosine(37)-N6)-methyltransferase TrmO [Candidatus Aerophobetes bacterium]
MIKKFELSPIGYVENQFQEGADPQELQKANSTLVIFPQYRQGLFRIEKNDYLDVLFYFHKSEGYKLKQKTRYGDIRGVFACRSPHRPNQIGLSSVKLLKRDENRLLVKGLDAINGTPILDIKPHIGGVDAKK